MKNLEGFIHTRRSFIAHACTMTVGLLGLSVPTNIRRTFAGTSTEDCIVLQVTCDLPTAMSVEEFTGHKKNITRLDILSYIERHMLADGRLLKEHLFKFKSTSASWTYVFRDRKSYEFWDSARMVHSPLKVSYGNNAFRYRSTVSQVPVDRVNEMGVDEFLNNFHPENEPRAVTV